MKDLIKHYFKNNIQEILDKSYLNCHVKGLHSIMLSDCPEKMIRLYITDKGHELFEGNLSIHPHHCDLTLISVYGDFLNYNYELTEERTGRTEEYYRSRYGSFIKGQKSQMLYGGTQLLKRTDISVVSEGKSIYLKAKQLHTVEVPSKKVVAWIVLEGKEDPEYEQVCYNMKDLSKTFDPTGLYIRPTLFEVEMLLQSIGVL